jgi:hypothetical protein
LFQETIHQRRLAVINVGDNGDISYVLHGLVLLPETREMLVVLATTQVG